MKFADMTFAAATALALSLAAPGFAETMDKAMDHTTAGTMDPKTGQDMAGQMMVGGTGMVADKTILDNAMASADHTDFVHAVKTAGLAATLSGPGPVTVFAPTDAAFAKLSKADREMMMMANHKADLAKTLSCHIATGDVMSPMLGKMIMADGGTHVIDTAGGCKLTASIRDSDKALQLTDENGTTATIIVPDVAQSNGVIHVIDTVLMPKATMHKM